MSNQYEAIIIADTYKREVGDKSINYLQNLTGETPLSLAKSIDSTCALAPNSIILVKATDNTTFSMFIKSKIADKFGIFPAKYSLGNMLFAMLSNKD